MVREAYHLRNDLYSVPADFNAELAGACFCLKNNAVLSANNCFVLESVSTTESFREHHIPLPRSPREPQWLDGCAVPLRSRFNNYYHTLIDNLPRLMGVLTFLERQDELANIFYRGKLSSYEKYFYHGLLAKGHQLTRIGTDVNRVQSHRMILGSFKTQDYAGYLPRPYVEAIRQIFWPERIPSRHNRILVSRALPSGGRRTVKGEDDLMQALRPLGFDRVALEDLSIPEQIELFYDAEIVVAPHGAGLANLLFSPSVSVVELFATRQTAPHYFFLAKSLGHKYRAVHGDGISFNAPIEVEVSRVIDALQL